MKRLLGILWIFMKSRIKGNYEYRAAFWLDTLIFVLGYGTQAAVMVLLVTQFGSINGWKPYEVMLLYTYVLSSYTLCNAFFSGVMWKLSSNIRYGDFDQSMTKPLNPLIYEIVCSFSPYYFLHFFLSLGMMCICIAGLGISLTIGKVVVLALSIIGGAFLQAGVLILFASATFILIENPLTGDFLNNIRPIYEYPISVLPKAVQILLTTILPLAFISFYPAQNLLSKSDFLMFSPVLQYGTLPIGVLVLLISFRVWNIGVRRYKSTGS
jgi:ABC-2 type transport system permease protein